MRPTKRPDKPYTSKDIPFLAKQIHTHFFVENNPRCQEVGSCRYNLTGCAIGCLLTAEDAEKLEYSQSGGITDMIASSSSLHDILKYYFVGSPKMIDFLETVQGCHDCILSFEKDFQRMLQKYMNGETVVL